MSKERKINPETGIFFIENWGYECARGFVSNARFARPGEQVITRTNRNATRKWREKLKQQQDFREEK